MIILWGPVPKFACRKFEATLNPGKEVKREVCGAGSCKNRACRTGCGINHIKAFLSIIPVVLDLNRNSRVVIAPR